MGKDIQRVGGVIVCDECGARTDDGYEVRESEGMAADQVCEVCVMDQIFPSSATKALDA